MEFRLKGIIFDLDDTLVDSQHDYALIRSDIGIPAGQGILEYIDEIQDEEARLRAIEILRDREMHGARVATHIPGSQKLLKKIDALKLQKAIFTRNEREPTNLVLSRLFPNEFDLVITRGDGPPKPDPSGLLKICEAWSAKPEEVIYIGDYDFDLDAGQRAGIKTILYLSDEPWPPYAEKAAYVTRSLEDLAERLPLVVTKDLGFLL